MLEHTIAILQELKKRKAAVVRHRYFREERVAERMRADLGRTDPEEWVQETLKTEELLD